MKTTIARIVPSLQLAQTEPLLHLTPYSYTFRTFRIRHSSRGTILCRLASRASSLGWLVGNKDPKEVLAYKTPFEVYFARKCNSYNTAMTDEEVV